MNWGYKLLTTYLIFLALMGYLVYRAVTVNFELVEKDYYKQEIGHQRVIDGRSLAAALPDKPSLRLEDEKIVIQFPFQSDADSITANVWFYCSYASKLDRKFDIYPDATGVASIPRSSVASGDYSVKIDWDYLGRNYYSELNLDLR